MSIPAGTRVDRYEIERAVGKGSMGEVMLALDVDLHRKVALKILSEKHRDNQELRGRFSREGRAVAAISHPNVVQVFSTGSYEDRPYIAMEFLKGVDLQTLVQERGPMSSKDAVDVALQAAHGLRAAADAGLIHRDVKPSNLVMLDSGILKVTDFGLAKPVDPSAPALTALGVVVGTPDYIAPEQARGDALDERVDIYALGGTMYFLVTGMPPFRKGDPEADRYLKVVARHLRDPAPDPRHRVPSVDSELVDVILTLMSKEPDHRPRYPVLITRLESLLERLSRAPSSAGFKHPSQPAPTPFIGSDHRQLAGRAPSSPLADGAGQTRPLGRAPTPEPGRQTIPERPSAMVPSQTAAARPSAPMANQPGAHPGTPAPVPSGPTAGRPSSQVPTTHPGAVTMRSEPGTLMSPLAAPPLTPTPMEPARVGLLRASQAMPTQELPPPRRRSLGLLLLTLVSIAVLAVGVLLKLTSSGGAVPAVAADASIVAIDAAPALADAAPVVPDAPAGTVLIRDPAGAPWFFVSTEPVARRAYREVFPRERAGGGSPAAAVTGISQGHATAYAQARGARLPTTTELRAARAAGAVAATGLDEWTAETERGAPIVLSPDGATKTRKDRGSRDLTFRLVYDLPNE